MLTLFAALSDIFSDAYSVCTKIEYKLAVERVKFLEKELERLEQVKAQLELEKALIEAEYFEEEE